MSTTTDNPTTGCFVHLTPGLKARLAARAEREKSNLNDVSVAILAAEFNVAFEPTGRASAEIGPSTDVILRMPVALKYAIEDRRTALTRAGRKTSQNALIVKVLTDAL